MANLTCAHQELFRRPPDERFPTLNQLWLHCRSQKDRSRDCWQHPQDLSPRVESDRVLLNVGKDGAFALNHWSFSQLCALCGVNRETLNRLSPETASRALQETIPHGNKPLQVHASEDVVRSIHGVAYSRLWNADLLSTVTEFATDFEPPPPAFDGSTGLYCGEEDCFAFLIDPAGWIDIGGQAFAPGMFVWNSEVGRRSFGIQAFWFQGICQNHICWDCTDVTEFKRKHTGNVADSLNEIRRVIEALAAKRDQRKDGFSKLIRTAMETTFASDSEEAEKRLFKEGISRTLVKKAVAKLAAEGQRFTLFALVDALTQLTGEIRFAGDRMEADQKIALLLSLAV